MMFKTTREVLDRIRKFHQMLSTYYNEVSQQTDQIRLRLLLDYMSRHEKNFEENLVPMKFPFCRQADVRS